MTEHFLDVRDLRVHFPTEDGLVKAVDGLSFTLDRGECVGIVGESGSGKSVTSTSILGLHRDTRAQVSGEIWLDGQELTALGDEQVRALRGRKMAMIFQDPLSALHPYYTVGSQISEAYRIHHDVGRAAARVRTVEMLDRVGIPNPDQRYGDYAHTFSGGMRQRAMIAMALVCNPDLLIADEPTTALDVTVQAQILELIKDVQREFNSAVLLITHDLGVVAEICDSVVVMYGGQCVEQAAVSDLFHRPEMPYTWGLLGSVARLDRARAQRLRPIDGQPPSLISVPSGCVFHPRCRYAERVETSRCTDERPDLRSVGPGHAVRCHLPAEQRRATWSDEIAAGLS
jgi:peptide/nickel transport system ATP-binding protein